MLERYITAPDGQEWVVGRKLLFGPPRYIGFRFGHPKPAFEPRRIRRVPATAVAPQSPSALVSRSTTPSWPEEESTDPARGGRYRHTGGTIWVPVAGGRSRSRRGSWSSGSDWSWSGSGSSSGSGRSFSGGGSSSGSGGTHFSGGGGSFGSSGGSSGGHSSGSSGSHSSGSSKSKGGGAAGGLAGLAAVLLRFLQVLLIAVAVIAAALLTIFVLIPALIFAFWALLVGAAILWHAFTRRAWIVEAREHRAAPRVLAWTVLGWRESRRVIDDVADAIADGRDPQPLGATQVTLVD